jgi:hypothetical protein
MPRHRSTPPSPTASLAALVGRLETQVTRWREHQHRARLEGGFACTHRIYAAVVADLGAVLGDWRSDLLSLDEAESFFGLGKRQLVRLAEEGRLESCGDHRNRRFRRVPCSTT